MPKLKLKRTLAEEAERQYRKSTKSRKRHKSRDHHSNGGDRRPEKSTQDPPDCISDEEHSEQRPSRHERSRADREEASFREKMWDALGEEERLDSIEAQFNDYAHVPMRWRNRASGISWTGLDGTTSNEMECMDPTLMDDDEYAEWVRKGMWRKLHAAEHAARLERQDSILAARQRERAIKAESLRLEAAAAAERRRKKQEKDAQRLEEARASYDRRWRELLAPTGNDGLGFSDIPWPVLAANSGKVTKATKEPLSSITLSSDAIASFLLPQPIVDVRMRKLILRETLLRFHPDKFEGRVMQRVREKEQARVREGVGAVARILGELMGQTDA